VIVCGVTGQGVPHPDDSGGRRTLILFEHDIPLSKVVQSTILYIISRSV